MATLTIDGRELTVRNLSTAKIMHVQELQRQSGLKLAEIHQSVAETDVLGMVVLSFLTQRTAGIDVKWDDLMAGSAEELGAYSSDPGDRKAKAEDEADADPQVSGTSDPDASAPPE